MRSFLFKYAETNESREFWTSAQGSGKLFILLLILHHMQPGSNGLGSVSRLSLELELVGRESVPCEIVRHLAPITARSILTSLPMQGLVHRFGEAFVYFETGLVIGSEKQRTTFKRGDIGLLVSNGSICIFLKDSTAPPMNPLGHITGDLQPLQSVRPGDVLKLKKSTA